MNDPQPTGYLADLLNQPVAVRQTLSALHNTDPQLGGIPARLARGDFHQVILTGMGSSYFAFHPLQQAMARRGMAAVMLETSELVHHLYGLLRPDTLVIAQSQSGASAEIIALIERVQRLRVRGSAPALVGITNTPGSPLDSNSDFRVLTRAGEEETVSCKTYLASLLAVDWLEPVLAGESPDGRLTDLDFAVQAVQAYLSTWREHVSRLVDLLRPVQAVFLVGRGPSLAAAGTGGLIIKEAAHFHSEGMSCAAFRHGPLEMVGKDTFVLVFAGTPPTVDLNTRLVADVRSAGGQAFLVSKSEAIDGPFRLPAAPWAALPLLEILPAQMMTLALAALKGHEAGKFTRATKITATE
jgi:glucosamine--fructose-6-phosphate aminotransferase (isomerizing)